MSETDSLRVELSRVENKLEAFRKAVDDRFDEIIELVTSNVRTIQDEIRALQSEVRSLRPS
jgi:hypothetical protein